MGKGYQKMEKKSRKVGRPRLKLSDLDSALSLLQAGNDIRSVALVLGVSKITVVKWLERLRKAGHKITFKNRRPKGY